ncbi:hypothetical protein E7Y32_03110 [Arthrobacter sp. UKPF54-2]|uniref:hypothetical protein n=1 Tax=Arthrobacter sp. UKPF54-2 TaxID=2600159 RepID=UPI0011B11C55|nr:hypothetical protein [Arthrobacter sp. UKPF54-2]QDY89310.1 hypothetical protein E7Y32_03110 [Arthrobacter sp. UKPF54-2]
MRTSPARTPFHSLRSAMVATTIVALAAAAHVVGGGQLPAPAILAAFLALTGLVSTAATRLKLNIPAMTGLLGAGQVVLHEAFAAFSAPIAGAVTRSGHFGTPGHHDGGIPLPVPAGHLQPHALDSALALSMFAGHTLATLACALLLARGEDALWQLAAWLRPLVQLPAPVTPRPVALRALPLWPAESLPLPWRNVRRECRRGPPAVVAFS